MEPLGESGTQVKRACGGPEISVFEDHFEVLHLLSPLSFRWNFAPDSETIANMKKQISRSLKNAREKRKQGICPGCGFRALEVSPNWTRNNEIRAAVNSGKTLEEVGKMFGLKRSAICRIAKKPAGKPKLLSFCKVCNDKNRERYKANKANANVTPINSAGGGSDVQAVSA